MGCDVLQIELEPAEAERLKTLPERKTFDIGIASYGSRSPRKKRIPPERIFYAGVLLGLGYPIWKVRNIVRIGQCTAEDLLYDRFDDGGRLPLELEPGEEYVPRRACEGCGGAWIDIIPCRACKARMKNVKHV